MNFDDTPQEAEFRKIARDWIEANRPDGLLRDLAAAEEIKDRDQRTAALVKAAKAWQKKKADAGFACPTWPKEYGGRAATPIQRVIWDQEEGKYGALSGPFAIGQGMCGPTVMAYATEEQKRRYLPPLASGEEVWCQLFSEPAGGSDLAGLRTKAEKDGDDWIINGQKIWTTGAHFSDYGILITRTDPTLPKHKGLTMFFLDMKSPGVEVRPIKQASGHSGFNEVYFTNVRIPDSQRLGKVNDGWNVSLTTLMNERFSIGARLATGVPEFFDFASGVKMADGALAIEDAAVRSRLATWASRANGLKYTSYRAISALSRGERPGPENSIGKLVAAPMMQDIAMYALDLQGQMGAVARDDASPAGKLYQMLYGAIGMRIAGGTDEVMRNIIAERVLGLPGDIRVDKDAPFNQIPTKGR
ncbi:MAG: acyl-CoA dehydrogenase family protein [Rhodoblastus sp.]